MTKILRGLKRIFIFLPLKLLMWAVEKIGLFYALLVEYPFEKGKRQAKNVYDVLKK